VTSHRLALLFIILIAFFLRLWQLPEVPPGLWYDEAYNAMDATWMADTGHYQPFVVGNNGREAMWHYLLIVSISLLGNNTFAVRLVGSLAGLLTIPMIYRFALALSRPFVEKNHLKSHRHWFAVAVAGWVAVSWWHLLNSRAGFRPVLLPPILMLSLYFFWRGWTSITGYKQSTINYYSLIYFSLAGLFLGLTQYTYLSARVAPFIFGGLAILWTVSMVRGVLLVGENRPGIEASAGESLSPAEASIPKLTGGNYPDTQHATRKTRVKQLWLGVLMSVVTATLVFMPLGLFFINNPDSFSSRTGDVLFTPNSMGEVAGHVLQGISLFLGAGHELYRHHLPGRAMLGWLEIPFFWLGLITLLRPTYLRWSQTQLILLGLGVMWIPSILASPPVHALRPIGILPFYYLIVTVGLYQAARMRYQVSRLAQQKSKTPSYVFPIAAAILITVNGLINAYDYFWQWADHPEVYKEFNGPLVDLTHHLIDLTATQDVIIPFHVYAHPTVRYLLQSMFTEATDGPPSVGVERPVEMLLVPDTFQLLYVGNIPTSPALVLLTRDEIGQGKIYVSRPPRSTEQLEINELLTSAQPQSKPFRDKLGHDLAYFIPLLQPNNQSANYQLPITNLFTTTPLRTISLNWADLVELRGYDVTPQLAQPGQPITVNLYWHSLTDFTFDNHLFLQIVDGAGNPINQWEGAAFGEDMYRWRPDGILPSQHTLWLGPDTPSGPYLIRLGFFDPHTGERLPLHQADPLNQVHLGLFYVSADGTDPRIPATPLSATFADVIQLTGVTLPDIQKSKIANQSKIQNLKSKINWQSLQPTNKPYTVFLQLLDEQGEVVSSWDSQPFGGLYPTNLWSPGEVIADTFLLPLPEGGLSPGSYRLITGFYDFETGQRLPVNGGGDFAELGKFVIEP